MCQELVMNLLACNVPSGQVSNVIKVVSESCSQIPNFRIALLWTGSARRIAFCQQQIAEEMQVSEKPHFAKDEFSKLNDKAMAHATVDKDKKPLVMGVKRFSNQIS